MAAWPSGQESGVVLPALLQTCRAAMAKSCHLFPSPSVPALVRLVFMLCGAGAVFHCVFSARHNAQREAGANGD